MESNTGNCSSETLKSASAFGELRSSNPELCKGLREIDYFVGSDMSKRTKRLINRTAVKDNVRPTRYLLTVLLDVMDKFRLYRKSIKVRKASDLYEQKRQLEHEESLNKIESEEDILFTGLQGEDFSVQSALSEEDFTEHVDSIEPCCAL